LAPTTPGERVLQAAVVSLCAVAVALRFMTRSPLWLDEALTVNIARLPLPHLFEALRHDGAPPAYYLLLHGWMKVFGSGDLAVRSLSGMLSLSTLPVVWRLGRAVGGRRVGLAMAVIVATSPFAIRYASENRMYALVMLVSSAGTLALIRALQRPSVARLVSFGCLCGLLLLTHYWGIYLVAATAIALGVWIAAFPETRGRPAMALAALVGGCLLFVPWVGPFLFQAAHTGTPWGRPGSPLMIVEAVGQFAGWDNGLGIVLFGLYMSALAVLVLAGLAVVWPRGRTFLSRLGLHQRPPGASFAPWLAGVELTTVVLALVGGWVVHATFAYRYASVVLPLVCLLLAVGVGAVGPARGGRVAPAAVLALVAVLGVVRGGQLALAKRTQAGVVAAQIRALARPGDVVAYCPDQLGPAVNRLLGAGLSHDLVQVTFPDFDTPDFVDWVDYAARNDRANPGLFASHLLNLADPDRQVFLVWAGGYRTFGADCEQLRDTLSLARPAYDERVVSAPSGYYEPASLERYAPS